MYETLDEDLTGEDDEMVGYVDRCATDDRIVLDAHDLSIGELNTNVMAFGPTGRKG